MKIQDHFIKEMSPGTELVLVLWTRGFYGLVHCSASGEYCQLQKLHLDYYEKKFLP
jgi:hypothetical protein